MVASLTPLPVLGVPVQSKALNGLDSLLSIVQMPAGVPTATFAIGQAGATNAALFAVRMLAVDDARLGTLLAQARTEAATAAMRSSEGLKQAAAAPVVPSTAAPGRPSAPGPRPRATPQPPAPRKKPRRR
jgi:phosphoribosylcarboxyaminoimidazole (NCAIR) mutase